MILLKKKNKSIPTKFLYDDIGSKLFEEISNTKEYYLTRTEKKILNAVWLECQLWQDCDTIMSEQNINDIQQQQRCSKLALEKFHLLVVAL